MCLKYFYYTTSTFTYPAIVLLDTKLLYLKSAKLEQLILYLMHFNTYAYFGVFLTRKWRFLN